VPEHNTTRAISTDVGSWPEAHRRSSQQAGIIAFALLLLGLCFLFHWKLRAVASAEPIESDAASGIVTPEIRSESSPTVWAGDGLVQSTTNH
jgi:hypothetical protein